MIEQNLSSVETSENHESGKVNNKFSRLMNFFKKNKKKILYGTVAVLFCWCLVKLTVVSVEMDKMKKTVRETQGKSTEKIDQISAAVNNIGRNSNELSRMYNLPETDLSFFDEEKGNLPEQTGRKLTDSDQVVLFEKAIKEIFRYEKENESIQVFENYLKNKKLNEFFVKEKFNLKRYSKFKVEIYQSGRKYFILDYDYVKNEISIYSADKNKQVYNLAAVKDHIAFFAEQKPIVDQRYQFIEKYSSTLLNLAQDSDIQKAIDAKKLSFKVEKNKAGFYSLYLKDASKMNLVTAEMADEGFFIVNETRKTAPEQLKSVVLEEILKIDTRSEDQKKMDDAIRQIRSLSTNTRFQETLSKSGLRLSMTPVESEDSDYISYNLYDKRNKLAGSFGVQKRIGEIYVMDKNGIPISSLMTIGINSGIDMPSKFFIPENIRNIDNIQISKDAMTFLLVGAHENNADTIILLYADKKKKTLRLISLPRDLYWDERKINRYYQYYGPEKLKECVSKATGIKIDRYAVIDMYAFIDAVNILGGIDVELKEPLIDSTYKIMENGKWSTLNYTAGMHHFNGLAALRVARSRHGSDDFVRAKRQQDIISAVGDKFKNIEPQQLLPLVNSLLKYMTTDISAIEAVNFFMDYKNCKVNGQFVLSTGNVLYHTSSKYGEYILLPRNNDWNVVKWFVSEVVKGKNPYQSSQEMALTSEFSVNQSQTKVDTVNSVSKNANKTDDLPVLIKTSNIKPTEASTISGAALESTDKAKTVTSTVVEIKQAQATVTTTPVVSNTVVAPVEALPNTTETAVVPSNGLETKPVYKGLKPKKPGIK